MTPRLSLRAAAKADLDEAFLWYEERSTGLGYEFLRAVRATLAQIERNPGLFAIALDDIRRAHLLRFPYALYYVMNDAGTVVLACAHGRQHPRRWQSRR
jgi:plasmid stabilization system protein ParE